MHDLRGEETAAGCTYWASAPPWIRPSLPRTGSPRERAQRRVQTSRVRRGHCEYSRPNRSGTDHGPPLHSERSSGGPRQVHWVVPAARFGLIDRGVSNRCPLYVSQGPPSRNVMLPWRCHPACPTSPKPRPWPPRLIHSPHHSGDSTARRSRPDPGAGVPCPQRESTPRQRAARWRRRSDRNLLTNAGMPPVHSCAARHTYDIHLAWSRPPDRREGLNPTPLTTLSDECCTFFVPPDCGSGRTHGEPAMTEQLAARPHLDHLRARRKTSSPPFRRATPRPPRPSGNTCPPRGT